MTRGVGIELELVTVHVQGIWFDWVFSRIITTGFSGGGREGLSTTKPYRVRVRVRRRLMGRLGTLCC